MKRVLSTLCFLQGAILGCAAPAPTGTASYTPLGGSGYTSTKNPIVLIPGLIGFKSILGAVEYFSGIPPALEQDGAQVFVVTASQAADSIVRGDQLIPQLDALRASTGAAKFNLIGHSQGAMDARYIAAKRPDLVASVTSVSGPHKGSPVADAVLAFPLGLGTGGLQALSDFMKLVSGSPHPNDAKAALEFLRPAGAAAFAAKYPAAVPSDCGHGAKVVGGIPYWSWAGQGWITNPVDILDPTWLLLGGMGAGFDNDGLVPRCSTHLGHVIRDDYMLNHIDATNLMLGLVSPLGPSPVALFRAHANRIKNAGL
jgi:triacylglycerol lipase